MKSKSAATSSEESHKIVHVLLLYLRRKKSIPDLQQNAIMYGAE